MSQKTPTELLNALLTVVERKTELDKNNAWYQGPESYLLGIKSVQKAELAKECEVEIKAKKDCTSEKGGG